MLYDSVLCNDRQKDLPELKSTLIARCQSSKSIQTTYPRIRLEPFLATNLRYGNELEKFEDVTRNAPETARVRKVSTTPRQLFCVRSGHMGNRTFLRHR
jgi:hypothetical protein